MWGPLRASPHLMKTDTGNTNAHKQLLADFAHATSFSCSVAETRSSCVDVVSSSRLVVLLGVVEALVSEAPGEVVED